MNKIFLIGDLHIGLGYPNSLDKWYKIHKEYIKDFLVPILKEKVEQGDIVVQMGDYFDNRNVLPINILNFGLEVAEEISQIAPLHILIGNHDLWSRNLSKIHSLRSFRWIPNVHIYDEPTKIEWGGLKILMMPYVDKKEEQIEIISKFTDCDALFCHSDLNGCKMHLNVPGDYSHNRISLDDFTPYKIVRSGHIHITQEIGKFKFIGSCFQMDRNDMGDRKGIYILDTKTLEEEFVPNMVSPVFVKIFIKTQTDIDNLDNLQNSKDFIDLKISNSLLMSNRKLRRKLEILLEKINFSSVEYLDDILKEESEQEISTSQDEKNITEEIFSFTNQLEYTDIIKEWIKNSKWDSKKTEQGILDEFDNIEKIYKDNYESKI